ncbi:MAG: hypothetical protein L6R36_001939 [Xanthoria steineri]|nr:MAG: hypothetical protein L6R36_001939 [Xanthoria steineri]
MPHDNSVAESPLVGTESVENLEQSYSQAQGTIESMEVRQQDITTSSSPKGKEYLDHTLQFLSTAGNETLGACLAGLGAATYFILGRIGLVLIGLVGGVVLHAIWEERNSQSGNQAESAEAKAKRRREDGLSILHRVLEWRNEDDTRPSEVNGDLNAVGSKPSALKQLNFSELGPATGAALTGLTDAVIRDYVKWWYGPLLPTDLSFPSACRQTLTSFLLCLSSHLARKRPADVFLDFLTNASSIVIVFLNELAGALTASTYSGLETTSVLHQYLDQYPSSSLASVLDEDQQKRKLKAVSEEILQSFLESKAYGCEAVRVFLRQILAGICLEMTVQSCSKPEWINGWIVYLLEQDEPGLMNAIDASIESTSSIEPSRPSSDQHQTSNTAGSSPVKESSHRRTVSRAEEAMDEAMQEAQRLSEMIAAEEAKVNQGNEDALSSGTATGDGPTPTSSQSDLGAVANGSLSDIGGDRSQDHQASESTIPEPVSSFTNFDQLLNSHPPTALQSGHPRTQPAILPLTLHNASISIFDDAMPGEKGVLRTKPTVDYLLQVEPASVQHPGWMIARKYADFETLHEVLRRISVVSGVAEFADRYNAIPGWKNRSKDALRVDLERYLRDALSFNRLAESEGMKRFLEKDQGLGRVSPSVKQGGFGFPTPAAFESMGKGMLDVLSAAPKGAAGGGKAIFGGVTGVLGGVGSLGQKKQASTTSNKTSPNTNLARTENKPVSIHGRGSQDNQRTSFHELDRARTSPSMQPTAAKAPPSKFVVTEQSPHLDESLQNQLHLPPPPSEIPDDWSTSPIPPAPRKSTSTEDQPFSPPTENPPTTSLPRPSTTNKPPKPPLSEQETRVAIELFFATITSLYTLSSAWTIRRTLLTAAKNFLLRPGNPNLEAIRILIQDTVIDANISDSGLASHIHKIRENALPTEAELKKWPPPMGDEEKERLRVKARKLLVEKGMPTALTGVMGAAASGEAVGKVFDALQIEEVARGLMGALILQGIRALVQ